MAPQPRPWFRKQTGWWMAQVGRRQIKLVARKASRKAVEKKHLELLLATNHNPAPESREQTAASVLDLDLTSQQAKLGADFSREAVLSTGLRGTCRLATLHRLLAVPSFVLAGQKRSVEKRLAAIVQRPFHWTVRQGLISRNPFAGVELRIPFMHSQGVARPKVTGLPGEIWDYDPVAVNDQRVGTLAEPSGYVVVAKDGTTATVIFKTNNDDIPEPNQNFGVDLGAIVAAPYQWGNSGGVYNQGQNQGAGLAFAGAVIKDNDPIKPHIELVHFAGSGNFSIREDPYVQNSQIIRGTKVGGNLIEGMLYSANHWLDRNHDGEAEQQYPVGYARGSTPLLVYRVYLEKMTEFRSFSVKAIGDWDFVTAFTSTSFVYAEPNGPGQYVAGILISDDALPNYVDYLESWTIDWMIRPEPSAVAVSAGQSKNQAYLTYAAPYSDGGTTVTPYHTFVHISTTNSIGAQTVDDVILGTWSEFTDKAVENVNGNALHYYAIYTNENVDARSLLARFDGQCAAWAKLFVNSLAVHGIKQQDAKIRIEPDSPSFDGFIIHDWNFVDLANPLNPFLGFPPGLFTNYNIKELMNINDDSSFVSETRYLFCFKEVTDEIGSPGQSTDNPASLFENHQIVRLTVDGQSRWFDPSYGETYDDLNEFATYVAGYYKDHTLIIQELAYLIDLDGDGDLLDSEWPALLLRKNLDPNVNYLKSLAQTWELE